MFEKPPFENPASDESNSNEREEIQSPESTQEETPEEFLTSYWENRLKEEESRTTPSFGGDFDIARSKAYLEKIRAGKFFEPVSVEGTYNKESRSAIESSVFDFFKTIIDSEKGYIEMFGDDPEHAQLVEKAKKIIAAIEREQPKPHTPDEVSEDFEEALDTETGSHQETNQEDIFSAEQPDNNTPEENDNYTASDSESFAETVEDENSASNGTLSRLNKLYTEGYLKQSPDAYYTDHQETIERRLLILEKNKTRHEVVEARLAVKRAKSKEAKQEAQEHLQYAEQEYARARAEYIGGVVEDNIGGARRKVQEETRLIQEQIDIQGEQKENKLVQAWRWLGEQNLSKLGWQPESRIGKMASRFLSLRTGLSFGLLGASFLVGGPLSSAGIAALIARGGMRSFGGSIATYDVLNTLQRGIEMPKLVKEERVIGHAMETQPDGSFRDIPESITVRRVPSSVSTKSILDAIQKMEARALMDGKSVTNDSTYQALRVSYFERIRSQENDSERNAMALESRLDVLKRDTDTTLESFGRRYRVLRKLNAAAGAGVGVVLGSLSLNSIVDAFTGHGEIVAQGGEALETNPYPSKPDTVYGPPEPVATPESPIITVETPVTERVSDMMVVSEKGDSVWSLIEDQLEDREAFTMLNESQRTYVIDYYKDYVVAHPELFGLENPEIVPEGTKIDFTPLFGSESHVTEFTRVVEQAQGLSPDAVAQIEENNAVLREWKVTHPDESLTTDKTIELLYPSIEGLEPHPEVARLTPQDLERLIRPISRVPSEESLVLFDIEPLEPIPDIHSIEQYIEAVEQDFSKLTLHEQEEILTHLHREGGEIIRTLHKQGLMEHYIGEVADINRHAGALQHTYLEALEDFYDQMEERLDITREEYRILTNRPLGVFMSESGPEAQSQEALELRGLLRNYPDEDISTSQEVSVDTFLKQRYVGATPGFEHHIDLSNIEIGSEHAPDDTLASVEDKSSVAEAISEPEVDESVAEQEVVLPEQTHNSYEMSPEGEVKIPLGSVEVGFAYEGGVPVSPVLEGELKPFGPHWDRFLADDYQDTIRETLASQEGAPARISAAELDVQRLEKFILAYQELNSVEHTPEQDVLRQFITEEKTRIESVYGDIIQDERLPQELRGITEATSPEASKVQPDTTTFSPEMPKPVPGVTHNFPGIPQSSEQIPEW